MPQQADFKVFITSQYWSMQSLFFFLSVWLDMFTDVYWHFLNTGNRSSKILSWYVLAVISHTAAFYSRDKSVGWGWRSEIQAKTSSGSVVLKDQRLMKSPDEWKKGVLRGSATKKEESLFQCSAVTCTLERQNRDMRWGACYIWRFVAWRGTQLGNKSNRKKLAKKCL